MRLSLLGLALAAGLAEQAPAPSPLVTPPARREVRLHYTAQDREVGRYQYVPVRVPAGTTRLAVSYSYDKAGGANVVDLGLFEPGSLDFGTPAFRGWSGGAAAEITVGKGAATPGYWPGPLPAGEWHVLLGLYKVGPTGVDVTLTTETSSDPDPAPAPVLAPRPTGPLRTGPAWYSGGVHLHTRHSDGELSDGRGVPARPRGRPRLRRDHRPQQHHPSARPRGRAGTVAHRGRGDHHSRRACERLGLGGWRDQVDFRLIAGDERIRDLVRAANDRGALFVINHPRADCPRLCLGAQRLRRSGGDGDHGRRSRGSARPRWRSGTRCSSGAATSWASARPTGTVPITRSGWPACACGRPELSERAILDAMRAGRVVVMADGAPPPPELIVRAVRRRRTSAMPSRWRRARPPASK
jgi:hypothetical protein